MTKGKMRMSKPFDLICMGMALVDSIIKGFNPEPISASGYLAASGSLNVGGEAVNEAIAAAKLGLKTGIVCASGDDEAGDMVRSALRRNGVSIVHAAKGAGTPVTTLFIHDEARYYTGKADADAMAETLLAWGVRHVIIKLGAKGCLLKTPKKTIRLPGYAVSAVDTTGAGDNFAAGFASEILRGGTEEEALLFANACGAVCTMAVGAGTALKSREQVLQFMKETALESQAGQ